MLFDGSRDPVSNTTQVTLDGHPLDPQLHLRNHSPTGFEWGYHGSGPAQLALAMLVPVIGRERALILYQAFKAEVIALLPSPGWALTVEDVKAQLERVERAMIRPGDLGEG